MQEEWRPVPGYEGLYEASDRGRVRSLDRYVSSKKGKRHYSKFIRGKILNESFAGGYLRISLSKNGNVFSPPVQWLVALSFIGPRPAGAFVLHNDDNPRNNNSINLRYGTRADNGRDAKINGKIKSGELHGNSKLNLSQVEEIRSSHLSCYELGRIYRVSASSIRKVKMRETWNY